MAFLFTIYYKNCLLSFWCERTFKPYYMFYKAKEEEKERKKKSLEWWLRDVCRFCISCGNKKVEKKLIVVQIKKKTSKI